MPPGLTSCTYVNSFYCIFSGILSKIQSEYHIGDAEGGALQTAFVVSYTIFAPIFGYLGDRYSRKAIMAFGVFLWTVFTVIGSFMPVRPEKRIERVLGARG